MYIYMFIFMLICLLALGINIRKFRQLKNVNMCSYIDTCMHDELTALMRWYSCSLMEGSRMCTVEDEATRNCWCSSLSLLSFPFSLDFLLARLFLFPARSLSIGDVEDGDRFIGRSNLLPV